ncbi:MAG: trehalose-6-phosphate synthase, partial [Chloroflexota bacterium]|nr:trehalose-6-phosphate synthase [Chloroflexota bacterium]
GRFLEKNPEYIGKAVLVQAGVMSRIQVDVYQQLSDQIEESLEEINGEFGRNDWQPIIYIPTDLPDVTLMALRRMARFCVVSSLHDGMNLVAKEYVATRFDEDGVLILSPFTGSAQELTDALIVNPYAVEQFADAIHQAVVMSRDERRFRMVQMRDIVQENNIYKWAAMMVVDLMQGARRSRRPVQSR